MWRSETMPLHVSPEFIFNLLAYIGLLTFTWGILDKKRQPWLFLIGGLMVWAFAVYGGNPIFVNAQTVMAVASFMRVLETKDAPKITIFLTALMLAILYFHGDINSLLNTLGVCAIIGLVLGVAFAQKLSGNLFFTAGGILMALYAYTLWSPPFLILNILFTLAVLWEIFKYFLVKNRSL